MPSDQQLEALQKKHNKKMKWKTARIKPEIRNIYIPPKIGGQDWNYADLKHASIKTKVKKYREDQKPTPKKVRL